MEKFTEKTAKKLFGLLVIGETPTKDRIRSIVLILNELKEDMTKVEFGFVHTDERIFRICSKKLERICGLLKLDVRFHVVCAMFLLENFAKKAIENDSLC